MCQHSLCKKPGNLSTTRPFVPSKQNILEKVISSKSIIVIYYGNHVIQDFHDNFVAGNMQDVSQVDTVIIVKYLRLLKNIR